MPSRVKLSEEEIKILEAALRRPDRCLTPKEAKRVDLDVLISAGILEKYRPERGGRPSRRLRYRVTDEGAKLLLERLLPHEYASLIYEKISRLENLLLRAEESLSELKKGMDDVRALANIIISRTGSPSVTEEEFIQVLREEYKRLVAKSPIAPYVQVEDLRSAVCRRLRLTRSAFDDMLRSLYDKNPLLVQFDVGTGRPGTGITVRRGTCYYVLVRT